MDAPTTPRKRLRSAHLFREMKRACRSPVPFDEKLDSDNREKVVEFMDELCNDFKLKDTTHGLAVSYCDRFMRSRARPNYEDELIGMVCVLVAAKFDDVKFPSVDALIERVEGNFTRSQVREAELGVLRALGWRLHDTTPHSFLNELDAMITIAPPLRRRAEFFANMATYESRVLQFIPAVLALASLLGGRKQLFPLTATKTYDKMLCAVCGVSHSEVERCLEILLAHFARVFGDSGC
tara:strand:+ start:11897 stop:12610 length:714 start_codon:yes stop_codon:yes gene_type:complete